MHVRMYTRMHMHRGVHAMAYYTRAVHVRCIWLTSRERMPPYASTCYRMLPCDLRHGSATAEQSP